LPLFQNSEQKDPNWNLLFRLYLGWPPEGYRLKIIGGETGGQGSRVKTKHLRWKTGGRNPILEAGGAAGMEAKVHMPAL